MKTTLFTFLFLAFAWTMEAQNSNPVITGDTMVCPSSESTVSVSNDITYDTYQWYFKPYFSNGGFAAIQGATEASLTYDTYNYDVGTFKVIVTLDGQTYESNTIQIDTYAWSGLIIETQTTPDVIFDPDQGYLICDGSTIINTIDSPYTVVQWYKNGQPIEGATATSLTITSAGDYYAVAAPGFCPNSPSTSIPMHVVANPDCTTNNTPVITGTAMQCPNSEDTVSITNSIIYDTYQWYYKPYFGNSGFVAIEGANEASFTYSTYTYDVGTFKVVTTLSGTTYESNLFSFDSYNWSGLIIGTQTTDDVVFDPDQGYLICQGSILTNTIDAPYTVIQWYKDGIAIEGATTTTFTITTPGVYYVTAAPAYCPNNISSTENLPIYVIMNPDCGTAGINDPEFANVVKLYPNPANSILNVILPENSEVQDYTIIDITGKILLNGKINQTETSINVESLSSGTYLVKINGAKAQATKMFIKQ